MPYLKKVAPVPEPLDCRILTAALELFVNNGYHNVSIHEIQKQADVSIGSIYKHFGGKEGVAKALYYHILNEIEELIDAIEKELSSPSAQCKEIIKQLFEHTETHRTIIAFVFHAKHTEFLPEEAPICDASPFKKIRTIVERGIQCGEFRKANSMVAASAVFGATIRMIQLRLDGLIKEPLTEHLQEVLDLTWQGLEATPLNTRKAPRLNIASPQSS